MLRPLYPGPRVPVEGTQSRPFLSLQHRQKSGLQIVPLAVQPGCTRYLVVGVSITAGENPELPGVVTDDAQC
jgi:hypothetical protein